MKRIYTILALCFLAQQLIAQPLPELFHYDFNQIGTSVTNQASIPPVGTGTATIMGALTQSGSATCYLGALNGVSGTSGTDYLSTGWSANLTGDWTISFVHNSTVAPAFSYLLGDPGATSFRCFTGGSGDLFYRGPFNDITTVGGGCTNIGTNVNTLVYDGTAQEIRSYLNGILNATVAQTTVPVFTGTGFKVGGYSTSGGILTGTSIDDFRIYNRAISPAEVLQIANACIATGLSEIFNPKVSIYPNPTNGISNIDISNFNGTISYSVISIDGKTIHQEQNITTSNLAIDLSNNSKGIYFLKLYDANSSKVFRIIKK
ncbi:MAG: T9SS type A sorting domain-containing protein [Flavobacteriales bacterium]|nr:T9SS type A sorting domain-containing protein [Flavobacteriales bacterium]